MADRDLVERELHLPADQVIERWRVAAVMHR
jgi:hypothetical protein